MLVIKVSDIERNLIFDSKNSDSKVFDFKVESSQQLVISVAVPESDNTHDIEYQGCVAILVGFKN